MLPSRLLQLFLVGAIPTIRIVQGFSPALPQYDSSKTTTRRLAPPPLEAYRGTSAGRSTPRYGKERSKRQERVGHLVRTELSSIIHGGVIKLSDDYLEADLRKRISVVSADVSPDLRQARIAVSITAPTTASSSTAANLLDSSSSSSSDDTTTTTRTTTTTTSSADAAVDKRRAYAWLVRNTKPIRHTLAQRLSHIKTCPNLSFVQVDVAAAVDVMYLIDKISAGGYKRDAQDLFGADGTTVRRPTGVVDGIDFDKEYDEDEWEEEDDDFF